MSADNGDFRKDLNAMTYHLMETVKLQQKLIERNQEQVQKNDDKIHKIVQDIAVMKMGLATTQAVVSDSEAEKLLYKQAPAKANKEIAKESGVAGLIIAVILGIFAAAWESLKAKFGF